MSEAQLELWPAYQFSPRPKPARPARMTREDLMREVVQAFAEAFGDRGEIVDHAALTAPAPVHLRCSRCGVLYWTKDGDRQPAAKYVCYYCRGPR